MTGISAQDVMSIVWVAGALLSILFWVFMYFFLSAVIRRGIDQSCIREQTDDIEEYHKNMLAMESQKLALLRMQNQMIQEQIAQRRSRSTPEPETAVFRPEPR